MKPCAHCGCDPYPTKTGKPRSVPQHRRYFSMIKAAYSHWPENHRFKPFSAEHLRRWLQVQAGYRIVHTADLTGSSGIIAAGMMLAAQEAARDEPCGEHIFSVLNGTTFYAITSRSVDFDTLPHKEACELFDAVAAVIEGETWLRVEQIMPPVQVRSKPREKLLEASL